VSARVRPLPEPVPPGGKIGVMDYYNLKNVQADTEMRQSLSQGQGSAPKA